MGIQNRGTGKGNQPADGLKAVGVTGVAVVGLWDTLDVGSSAS